MSGPRSPACSTPRRQAKRWRAPTIVEELAAPLPAMMIGKLLGFPDERWPKLKHWSERTIAMGGGPRYFDEDGMTAAMEFGRPVAELFAEKKGCPADDVIAVWTTAEIDGDAARRPSR